MAAIIVVCIDVNRVDDEGFVILLFSPLLTLLHDDLKRLFLSLWGIVVLAEKVFDHLAHTCLCGLAFIPIDGSILAQLLGQFFGEGYELLIGICLSYRFLLCQGIVESFLLGC